MRAVIILILFIIAAPVLAQQGGSCETAIPADGKGFAFPELPPGSKAWYKFSAKEPKAHLDIPAGNSFVLYEYEGDDFCGALKGEPKKQKMIAKRNITPAETSFELPSYSEEVLNGKCDCNSCTGGKFKDDISLRPDAQYYLLLIGEGKGVKLDFIAPPPKNTPPVKEEVKPKQKEVTKLPPTKPLDQLKVGEKVVLNILFQPGSPVLLPESKPDMMKLLNFMKSNPKVKIEIHGHVNGNGNSDDKGNMQLSVDRAKAVYDMLVKNGIDAARLSYKGFGATKMVYIGFDEGGMRENRRVEVMIVER